jgi:peroxiredoxin
MKKSFLAVVLAAVLFSCNNNTDKNKFTLNGELKGASNEKLYLEELFFSQAQPEILDTTVVKDGKFSLSAIADEEGLYRLRNEAGSNSYLFTNDGTSIHFMGDAKNTEAGGYTFSGGANYSLKKIMLYADSIEKLIGAKEKLLNTLKSSGVSETDSTYLALSSELKKINDDFTGYCFAFADTVKNPVVALFAATLAPVQLSKIEAPLAGLAKRFPAHKGIAGTINYIKELSTKQAVPQQKPAMPASIGNPAPEITMNDISGKPFSLSQLRGKYVLVDFWASWCGPCRGENPNVLAAYNQFKNKNFTVLGVSLDDNKTDWLNAIAEDKLDWIQVSDLKKWSSAAVALYGFDGIPYNVLVDPQGKIIATSLRGGALQNKLTEVLK